MAYASLISLENTIDRIMNHTLISISHEEKQQIICLREYAVTLTNFLEKFPDKFNNLEGRMREVTNKAEDILEYIVLEKLEKVYGSSYHEFVQEKLNKVFVSSCDDETRCNPSDYESGCDPSEGDLRKHELELLFQKVMEDIYLIAVEVKVLEKVMEEIDLLVREVREIKPSSRREDADSSALTSTSTAHATVGFEDYFKDIKGRLCGEQYKLQVIPICGMGGIGKTTLARKIYEDPVIKEQFEIRVWVTVSQDYSVERILSNLLESLKEFNTVSAPNDAEKVRKILMLRKYVIVMDDMWSSEAWDVVKRVFPDSGNGSRIILTTRLSDVAYYPDPSTKVCEMQLMDADQSWSLFKQMVFEGKDYPELENIGKEIASSCKGLPLAIVVIAGLLSTVSKNPDSWQEIAKKAKSVKTTEQEQIEEVLSLSYTHLPQHLRPCFLYMGSFPEDEEINVSRLVRLWVAEGFVKCLNRFQSLEDEAEECLNDLVKRNLVLVTKKKFNGRVKSCSLHDLMRDLSIRKAHESKFLLNFMDKNVDEKHFLEKVKNERRVSVDSYLLAFLLSFDDTTIHTVMCSSKYFDNYHFVQRSETLNFVRSVSLLRVLDAEAVDVDWNQMCHSHLFDLFHLRYLAIRLDHGVPLSWLNLQNLQTLIVHKLDFERSREFCLYWCMPQLRHVYFDGTLYFVDPKGSDSPLENLQTLSFVSQSSCKERFLKMMPSLKKLKIDYSGKNAVYLNALVHLHQLESLEIYTGRWDRQPKKYKFSLPMMLKKICLAGMKLHWDDMDIFGSLPDLRVLKLIHCDCMGSSTWETSEGQFSKLEFLLIQSLYFWNWITESSHFPRLRCLILDDCRYLDEIPSDIGEIPTLELIEIKGRVKKSLVKSAEEIRKEQEDMGNTTLQVDCVGVDCQEQEFAIDEHEDEGDTNSFLHVIVKRIVSIVCCFPCRHSDDDEDENKVEDYTYGNSYEDGDEDKGEDDVYRYSRDDDDDEDENKGENYTNGNSEEDGDEDMVVVCAYKWKSEEDGDEDDVYRYSGDDDDYYIGFPQ